MGETLIVARQVIDEERFMDMARKRHLMVTEAKQEA